MHLLSEDLRTELVNATLNCMHGGEREGAGRGTGGPKQQTYQKDNHVSGGRCALDPCAEGLSLGNDCHCDFCSMPGNASYIENRWEAGQGGMLGYV